MRGLPFILVFPVNLKEKDVQANRKDRRDAKEPDILEYVDTEIAAYQHQNERKNTAEHHTGGSQKYQFDFHSLCHRLN
jgi:hypothetical protein